MFTMMTKQTYCQKELHTPPRSFWTCGSPLSGWWGSYQGAISVPAGDTFTKANHARHFIRQFCQPNMQ